MRRLLILGLLATTTATLAAEPRLANDQWSVTRDLTGQAGSHPAVLWCVSGGDG
jgi:hypothetical protein